MPKPYISRTLVARIPLDREDFEVRIYRKVWRDHSECFDIQKWGCRDGVWTYYHPGQHLQIPVGIAAKVLNSLHDSLFSGKERFGK